MAKKERKVSLNISVTPEQRTHLKAIAKIHEVSISSLIGSWATTEYKKIERSRKRAEKKKMMSGSVADDKGESSVHE